MSIHEELLWLAACSVPNNMASMLVFTSSPGLFSCDFIAGLVATVSQSQIYEVWCHFGNLVNQDYKTKRSFGCSSRHGRDTEFNHSDTVEEAHNETL